MIVIACEAPGVEAWKTKLAMLRSYRRAHGHLAPRQDAVWGGRSNNLLPVRQPIAGLRRKGALGKDPERAEKRAAQLTAVEGAAAGAARGATLSRCPSSQ
ncbi:hypothetical protein [Streptomyces sp. NPDC056154]|uniref:hypothetical protein n=1 Tax=unclassified Streptomyces TaxID=2593676 RepID=UPI0035D55C6F